MKATFVRLVKLALPFKWWMLLAAFVGFLTVGSGVGLLMTSAYLIARAALHPSVAELQVAIVGVRFFGITRGIFRYIERLISHEVTFRLLAQFRVWFYKSIEPLAPSRLARFKSGDLLSRLVADVESLQNFYVRVLAPPLTAFFVSLLMAMLFGVYSWQLSALLLLFLALAGIGVPLATHVLSRRRNEQLLRWQGEFSALLVESIQGMPDLLVYGQGQRIQARVEALGGRLVMLQKKSSEIHALHEALIGLLANGAVFTILVSAIPLVSNGALDALFLSVLALGTLAAFEAVMPLPDAALHLQENLRAAERLFETADTADGASLPLRPGPMPKSFLIEFRNTDFSYEKEKPILSRFNLTIPQGERLLIVGPSGVGKTTLASLMRRFLDVQRGDIFLGGVEIRMFSQARLADIIGYVPQNAHVFSGTIRDNLLLGDEQASEARMLEACRRAHIDDFFRLLPDGFDTWVGEQGVRMSGGERQRLALARAFLKDTPVLILDEPCSSLDADNAQNIFQAINSLPASKTIIVMSHLIQAAQGWNSLSL